VESAGGGSAPRNTGTIAALALLALAGHAAVNLSGGYGYFRDELYYIACSRHLASGYVDQPPLSIFLLAAARRLLGDSVFAIRLVPALASAACVTVLCALVRRMGGGRAALIVASLCFLASPQLLSLQTYYSMNCFDILFWLLAAHAMLLVVEQPRLRAWLWLGTILGLGLLNKTSVLWLAMGVAAAVVLGGLRAELRRPGPWLAALLALAIFSPFVFWNLRHGLPHLEFMRNATAGKYSSLTRLRFLGDQFRAMNPLTFLASVPGLGWCLFDREGRRHRVLGISFLAVLAVLLANPHTKSEYVAAAYAPLFACGAVAMNRLPKRLRRVALPATAGLLAASGALLAPLAMPVLPVESYIRYAKALGVAPSTPENKKLSDLPQFFADMQGWEELARDVSAAYLTIPEKERKTTVALVGNYGEAGALDLYTAKIELPRVISNHNSYWFWGVGPIPITTFIRLGGKREDYLKTYDSVTAAGVHHAPHAMPYEDELGIFIVRGRHTPIEKAWPELKHFE
jgi:dolichyl-phosphate-mannose-protein mannosyltransferase